MSAKDQSAATAPAITAWRASEAEGYREASYRPVSATERRRADSCLGAWDSSLGPQETSAACAERQVAISVARLARIAVRVSGEFGRRSTSYAAAKGIVSCWWLPDLCAEPGTRMQPV